jgi:hypothetical protein
MRRINHLKELVADIKKTDEMILLHKNNDGPQIMAMQYEALKAKQVGELIDELATSPFQSVESFSVIKLIISKYYPLINTDKLEQKELRELAMTI